MTEPGEYFIWGQAQKNIATYRKTFKLSGDAAIRKKVAEKAPKPAKPETNYYSNTDIRKSKKFSLLGMFSFRSKLIQPAKKTNKSKLTVSRLSTPTYYMRNLQFNFKLQQDDDFSMSYKEHFHKNWIDLRYNANLIKIKMKDVHFRKIDLPPVEDGKLTVVLNLDDTLISCCKDLKGDATININYKGKELQVR